MSGGAARTVSLLLALAALDGVFLVAGCGATDTGPSDPPSATSAAPVAPSSTTTPGSTPSPPAASSAPPAASSAPLSGSSAPLSPSPTPALWSVAASFADYRSAVTQPFTLSGGEQLFKMWFEEGRLTVAVVPADDRARTMETLRYEQAGETESTLHLPAGEYVLDVTSTGAWAVEVRER
jgi:hypothetical protein